MSTRYLPRLVRVLEDIIRRSRSAETRKKVQRAGTLFLCLHFAGEYVHVPSPPHSLTQRQGQAGRRVITVSCPLPLSLSLSQVQVHFTNLVTFLQGSGGPVTPQNVFDAKERLKRLFYWWVLFFLNTQCGVVLFVGLLVWGFGTCFKSKSMYWFVNAFGLMRVKKKKKKRRLCLLQ